MRIKSHASLYACLLKRKSIKLNMIAPNHTRRRTNMLLNANKIRNKKNSLRQLNFASEISMAIFKSVLISIESVNGSKVHAFESLKGLDNFLLEHHIIPEGFFKSVLFFPHLFVRLLMFSKQLFYLYVLNDTRLEIGDLI